MSNKNNNKNKFEKEDKYGKRNNNRTKRSRAKDESREKDKNSNNYRSDRSNDSVSNREGMNHVTWYCTDPELLNQVAALTLGKAAGSIVNPHFNTEEEKTLFTGRNYGANPGICTLKFYPSLGKDSLGTNDAIETASNMIYTNIRANVANNLPYTKTDVMMYCMAADSVYMLVSAAYRAFGCIGYFNGMNKYYGDPLINALGFDAVDMRLNYNAWYAYLAATVKPRLDQIMVPGTMPIFIRHFWACQNIYTDGEDIKSQLYAYVPGGYYFRKPIPSSDFKSTLEFKTLPTEPLNLTQFKTIIDSLINSLLLPDDLVRINGDLKKTYPTSRVVLDPLPINYATPIVYNPEVLMQIENTVVVPIDTTSLNIMEDIDNDKITYQPEILPLDDVGSDYNKLQNGMINLINRRGLTASHVVNFHSGSVTSADMMVATRNQMFNTGSNIYEITDCGTELFTAINIYYFDATFNECLKSQDLHSYTLATKVVLDESNKVAGYQLEDKVFRDMLNMSQFDWAPRIDYFNGTLGDPTQGLCGIWMGGSQDLDNWTVLLPSEFVQMNSVALKTLYGVTVSK